jgi:hypothetical protein
MQMGNDVSAMKSVDSRYMRAGYSLPDIILYHDRGFSSLYLYPFLDYKNGIIVSYEELRRTVYHSLPWSSKDTQQILSNVEYLLSVFAKNRSMDGVVSYEETSTGYRIFFQSSEDYHLY